MGEGWNTMKKEILELFDELLIEYKSSQKTIILEYSTDEEQDLKKLEETIDDYKQRLNEILNK